eukprot:COSAG02_NODE_595_length_19813_cov_12.215380_17_plen_350_part_00
MFLDSILELIGHHGGDIRGLTLTFQKPDVALDDRPSGSQQELVDEMSGEILRRREHIDARDAEIEALMMRQRGQYTECEHGETGLANLDPNPEQDTQAEFELTAESDRVAEAQSDTESEYRRRREGDFESDGEREAEADLEAEPEPEPELEPGSGPEPHCESSTDDVIPPEGQAERYVQADHHMVEPARLARVQTPIQGHEHDSNRGPVNAHQPEHDEAQLESHLHAVVPPPPPIQGPVVCDDSSGDDDELGIVKVKCGAEDHGPLGIVFQEVSIKSVDPSGMGQFRAGRPLERGMLLRAINDVPADRLAFNAYAPTLILPFSLSSRSSLSDLCPPLQSRALYNRLYGS